VESPAELRQNWESVYVPAVIDALEADPEKTNQLLLVTNAPIDPFDINTVGETVIGVLAYSVFGTEDAQVRLGGQPYDNIGRVYHGSLDDEALNAGVTRVAADPGARAGLGQFETTGSLTIPFGVIHTSGDPVVPAEQADRYVARVEAAGASSLLTHRTVDRYGHCAFEAAELLDVFSAVVARATAAARID
jgi:pimeloyl-ACP methyl ester carboxylesterase